MRSLLIYNALSSLLITGHALADTVQLKNGDRISGTIVLLDSGRLLLKTAYAGTLSLDVKQVASVDTDQPLLARQHRGDDSRPVYLYSDEHGQQLVLNGSEHSIRLQDVHQLMPVQERKLLSDLQWKGSLHLSADYKRKENDSDKYELDLDNQLRHGRWRHGVEAEYEHETKNDSKKTDRFAGVYGLDYFITQRWFWKAQGKYTSDQMEDLRRQTTVGTGPGYQFWDSPLGSLSASTLFNHNVYSFANGQREHFNSLTASWDYRRYFMAKNLELYYKGEAGLPFTPVVDYVLDHETGLRYKLNSWASLSLRAEWEQVGSDQGSLNDRRYLMGVGVSW